MAQRCALTKAQLARYVSVADQFGLQGRVQFRCGGVVVRTSFCSNGSDGFNFFEAVGLVDGSVLHFAVAVVAVVALSATTLADAGRDRAA